MFKYANRTITIEFGPEPAKRHYHPRYRSAGLKFNPYVGTFHYCAESSISSVEKLNNSFNINTMESQNTNPLLPFFRHSPPVASSEKPFGELKEVIAKGKSVRTPIVISQLNVNKVLSQSFKLKTNIRYSSRASDCSLSSYEDVGNEPRCAICLEEYIDGVEIFTLSCAHCFHKDCVNTWLHQTCNDRNEKPCSFPCPKCRHEHIISDGQMLSVDENGEEEDGEEENKDSDYENESEDVEERVCDDENNNDVADTTYIGLADLAGGKAAVYGYVELDVDMGISSEAFERMGQHQYDEGGYDFLSDIELTISRTSEDPKNLNNSESEYSLCGIVVEASQTNETNEK